MIDDFDPASYWDERLQENWGLHAVGCIGYGEEFNRAIYQVKAEVFRRAIATIPLDLANARIMDVGPGVGFVIDLWLDFGARNIQAADISEYAVLQLEKSYPGVRFVRCDISSEDFLWPNNARFDCISALDVLYHIVEDDAYRRALGNLSNLLDQGGYLVFSDNFLNNNAIRFRHQVSHSRQTLEGWLSEAGFRIVWRRPQYVLLNYPVDSKSRLFHFWWQSLTRLLLRHPDVGAKFVRSILPVELTLTHLFKEGPSTELAVCQKIS